ncbi:MAG: tRNA uridine-5-carboxymethylaminomethyl(34) synthesis enzyme MnmG [Candidatus Neomarinimicrobiota bacterium]
MVRNKYDVVVIGGGHSGVEAALISSYLGVSVSLVTMDKNAIARMSCNPAIGGLAKGQIVREIDVLGGVMAETADISGLQFKTLNKSKGRAVWSPRAQIDKRVYEKNIYKKIKNSSVSIIQSEAISVDIQDYKIKSVFLRSGEKINCSCLIITAGTFLSGLIHIGERKILAGRMGEERSEGITESLKSYGFFSGRLKTGTPPRIDKKTVNWKKTSLSFGDDEPIPFSYSTGKFLPPNEPCHTIYTNNETHSAIRNNLHLSPMYSGDINGTGPRYCPSIEDKINRFKERNSHLLHLEPEWKNSDQIYLNGFSTSLPEEAQIKALRSIPALKNVTLLRPGYAIEYDFFPPSQVKTTLETKNVSGLFFAGQMNGTSGYEEAAAQGLVCGINAVKKLKGEKTLTLPRDSSYIGVMIDDLITKDTLEPYRMFTSRAEYRLMLRYSNTFERLLGHSSTHGLLPEKKLKILEKALVLKNKTKKKLNKSITQNDIKTKIKIKQKTPAIKILKRPEVSIFDLPLNTTKNKTGLTNWLEKDVLYDLESDIKYEGYIKRHQKEINRLLKNENKKIPKGVVFSSVPGLSKEALEKLNLINPENLGQASRISGITPADISSLFVFLSK